MVRRSFGANWTTVLIGWNGLGMLSPWPGRWTEFPSLLSREEIVSYANERLERSSNSSTERDLVLRLLAADLPGETREEIKALLEPLSEASNGNPALELRKWRLVLLEQLLRDLPQGRPSSALVALTEFWQDFGFPGDSPHEVQGRDNTISPLDYYQQRTLDLALAKHLAWIDREKLELPSSCD